MAFVRVSNFCVHLFGSTVCVLMRVIPRRYRFRLAVAMVRVFPYSLRHTLSLRLESMPGASTMREAVLSIILEAMDCRRIQFEPLMRVEGFDLVRAALFEGRGVLLVGTHTNGALSRVALRMLYDAGVPVTPISIKDKYAVCGAGMSLPTIHPSGTFMIRVRTRLRKPQAVCMLIDTFKQSPKQPLELRAKNGSIWANDSLFRLALACNAKVIFAATRLARDGRLAIKFQAASPSGAPEECWNQFASFIERHMASI